MKIIELIQLLEGIHKQYSDVEIKFATNTYPFTSQEIAKKLLEKEKIFYLTTPEIIEDLERPKNVVSLASYKKRKMINAILSGRK